MNKELGELIRVNLREAWMSEGGDFTPWLAQEKNLSKLADELGLVELEVVQTEYQVGDFKQGERTRTSCFEAKMPM